MDHTLLQKSCYTPVKTASSRGFWPKLNYCFVS